MVEPKHQFTTEIGAEAARLARMSGRSRREVAADLGVGLSTLRNWIDGRRDREIDAPPADRQEEMAAELKSLRGENKVHGQVREILKRATALLLRYVAADHQYRHDHHHLPDGLPDPKHTEPRRCRNPSQTGRDRPRQRRAEPLHRHRAIDRGRTR